MHRLEFTRVKIIPLLHENMHKGNWSTLYSGREGREDEYCLVFALVLTQTISFTHHCPLIINANMYRKKANCLQTYKLLTLWAHERCLELPAICRLH